MTDIILHTLQAVFGAFVVYWMRNDEYEDYFGLIWGRALWLSVAMLGGAVLIGIEMFTRYPGAAALFGWAIGLGILGYVLTAPHGQTLRGPHQDIPPDEDDPCFEVAMFVSGHKGGAGDRLGWPTWLIYNGLRYVFPMALLGALLGSWAVGVGGLFVVLGYWPAGHLLAKPVGSEPQFVGAFIAGAVIFGLI